jgi:hypothetical protein
MGRFTLTRAFLFVAFAAGAVTACAPAADEAPEPASLEDELATGIPYVSADSVSTLVYDGAEQSTVAAESTLERRFGAELSPPYAQTSPGATLRPWDYLRRMSAFSHAGPVSHFGPLGPLGPIGDSATSPDTLISGHFAWSSWARFFTAMGGPLSARGPLGRNGPANPIFWEELPERLTRYWSERPDVQQAFTNDFIVHLRPGGIFGVVGPTGPLGAFGPLGALGPIGAHGYARRGGGDYVPNSFDVCHDVDGARRTPPCRTIDVDWAGSERRTYELFESYTEEKAKELNDQVDGDDANDTSFLVRGSIAQPGAEIDDYVFRSRTPQWVMVTLVPESAKYKLHQVVRGNSGCDKTLLGAASEESFEAPDGKEIFLPHSDSSSQPCASVHYDHRASYDDFDVELDVESRGKKRAKLRSGSRDMIDWVQVLVPTGAKITAHVSLAKTWKPSDEDARVGIVGRSDVPSYRMIVVGSSPNFVLNTRFKGAFAKRSLFE